MSVRIIIDSTTDVSPAYQNRVRVVPLTIRFGDTELIDGVTVSRQRFYEMLVESDELPTTSQASPAAFEREYASAAQAGDSAVVLTISAQLSGTHQSACIAAQDFENVVVVDSQSATIGAGILAQYAVDCAERGMPAAEIAARLEEKRDDVCVIALLDTLEYLKRGGRISKTAAIAGGLLNLKPVASIENGRVNIIGKARGSRQGNNLLIAENSRLRRRGLRSARAAGLYGPFGRAAAQIHGGQPRRLGGPRRRAPPGAGGQPSSAPTAARGRSSPRFSERVPGRSSVLSIRRGALKEAAALFLRN